ncbi:antibiotic biosynthesis monooxygenase [Amphritea sp. HPY]|uniref:antibiotic biosynthesis monooxygenase n=1 Tax=Amphritea sp. HPY TaxID=3421652 RepID=UPI003D7D0A7C
MTECCIQEQLTEPGREGPVTVSISRRVKPGMEVAYEAWVSGVIEAAASFGGHQGSNVLRPGPATQNRYVLIYRFDSFQNCDAWEQSDLRKSWLTKLGSMVEGEAEVQRGTGLEFWFDLPELPVNKHPSPHKMALVLISVVYVLVIALNLILQPVLHDSGLWFRSAVIVIAQVLLMTYLVMPRVTRLLKGWLYK